MICVGGQLMVLRSRPFRLGVRGRGVAECVYKRASSLVLIRSLTPTRRGASGLLSRVGGRGLSLEGDEHLGTLRLSTSGVFKLAPPIRLQNGHYSFPGSVDRQRMRLLY